MVKGYKKKLLYLILIPAFFLRLVNLNQSLWLDEAAQAIESARPLVEQFDLAADFHPPLYHLILHFFLYIGRSEIWLRLPSVALGLLSIFLTYKVSNKLFNQDIALLSAFFLSISPYHIWYSQEARPYILFVAASSLTVYFLIKHSWRLYTLSCVLCLYSVYFAPFLLAGELIFVFYTDRKYIKDALKSNLFAYLAFIPWLPSFIRQLQVGTSGSFSGWTQVVSFIPQKAFLLTFAKFIFGKGSIDNNLIYLLVVLPVFLIFLSGSINLFKQNKKGVLYLFFTPFSIAIFFSFFIPILAPQRLIFLLPLFYLIVAFEINRYRGRVFYVFFIVVLATSLAGVFQYYKYPQVQRERWRQAVSYVNSDASANKAAVFVFPEPFAPFQWYSQKRVDAFGIAPRFTVAEDDLANISIKISQYDKIFLFDYLTDLTDPEEKTENFLLENGFTKISIKDFPGVGFVYVYEKNN